MNLEPVWCRAIIDGIAYNVRLTLGPIDPDDLVHGATLRTQAVVALFPMGSDLSAAEE